MAADFYKASIATFVDEHKDQVTERGAMYIEFVS
jgi:hypothetical protein